MSAHLDSFSDQPVGQPTRSQTNLSLRILVVEDDAGLRLLTTRVLLRSGYVVDAAEDGAAGWAALHANCYHLLITDHQMPNLSGVELIQKVRSARMPLPIILASGAMPLEEMERDSRLQPVATLAKPFSADQLLQTVKEVLQTADSSNVDCDTGTLQFG